MCRRCRPRCRRFVGFAMNYRSLKGFDLLLNQELFAPVFIGLEVNLTGKNGF